MIEKIEPLLETKTINHLQREEEMIDTVVVETVIAVVIKIEVTEITAEEK